LKSTASNPYLLLTGAAGGIAASILEHLTTGGWSIVATDHPDALGAAAATDPATDPIHWIHADLQTLSSDPKALHAFEAQVRTCLNGHPLHAVIHNAALQRLGSFAHLSVADWQATLAVNLLAPVAISRLFLEDLIATKGSIVHISSIHSQLTKAGFTAYATSKAALSGLTRAMGVELGDRVRVNAIEPAAIRTAMLEAGFADHPDDMAALAAHHPTGAIGEPKDVARAVAFLLDPTNRFLNGCVLQLGGGIHARLHDPI
jgi:NAD(P)-dependent dehydrogenase (short-subunit alcohol dehydrogenase family)